MKTLVIGGTRNLGPPLVGSLVERAAASPRAELEWSGLPPARSPFSGRRM